MIASERDALTGLANRQGFNRAARLLIDSHPEERFVLAYGDIDRFKVFNDHFGTDAGDRLLADVGKMIAASLPRHAVACRLRADHFVCCLPRDECDPDRMLALLDAWFARYPVDFAFFVRLGVYDIDDSSLDVSLMTDRALLALRASKTGPQSSKFVRFDESLRDSVIREQELAGQMSAALKAGQFELYFQPQYRFTAGELVGAEVLARWNHPEKGLISPAEFIPVFERTGLVSELDYYIWAEACRCLRAWLDEAGPDGKDRVPRLSVNLSRADIYRPDLCDYLVSLVEQNDVPFDLLHLEITEGFYLEDPEQLMSTVRGLQEAGFTVEMDDFGSGYSSLNALKDVPVDVLKLDLRFLDARNDTRGGVILASVVRMARWLDLPVIAEGVEAESQALFLSSIGCDTMQGFWFSRPVDRVTYEGIMRSAKLGIEEASGSEPRKEVAQEWDVASDKTGDLQLKAQAELQQQLFEAVPCGIVRYLVEGDPQVVSANRAAWTMLGCSSHEEFLARVADDAFAPFDETDRRMMADVVVQLRAGSPPVPFEARVRRFDGDERWIEGMSALAATPDGRLMVQSAFNDVTEGRVEHHRRELQRFTSVLCSVYDEVFEFDIAHDTYVLCYSAYRSADDAQPVPMHEALARWFTHILRPEHREAVQAAFDRCRAGTLDEPFSVTYCFEAGGRLLWYETSFLRVSETSVLCCNNNVTGRMDAEDERLDQRVGDIVNSLPAGIGVYDLDEEGAHPRFVSGAVRDMVGVARDDYGALVEKCASVAKLEDVRSFLAAHKERPFDFTKDIELEREGCGFIARVQGRATELADGTLRVYAVIVDVTDEVRAQRERAWQSDRFRILSELTHTISFDYDSHSDTVLLYIDRTGHGMEEQVIHDYLKTLASTRSGVVHPDSIDTVRAMFERARAGTRNEIIEYQADYYGTGYQWYRTNLYVAYDETGAWHLIGPIENIQTERELRVRAEHDAITGLSNYASARDLINDALADPHVRAHSVCAAVDIDDFKAINDSYGHLKGDELLQRVGAVLRSNCRESDVVGRVGGDEFVLFYKNIGLEVAVRKLAMIKRTIALVTLSDEDEGLPRPSISIGATATCKTDALYRDVLARADRALYAAKRSGKNRLRLL